MNKIEKYDGKSTLVSPTIIKGGFELLKTYEGQRASVNIEKNTKDLINKVSYSLDEKKDDTEYLQVGTLFLGSISDVEKIIRNEKLDFDSLIEKYKERIILLEHKFIGYNIYDVPITEDYYYDYSLLSNLCEEKNINLNAEKDYYKFFHPDLSSTYYSFSKKNVKVLRKKN